MTYTEFEEMMIQDEKQRQANPTCYNCNRCYQEYGYYICKKHDLTMENMNDKCDDWN